MRPGGEAAYARRRPERTAIYSFEQHLAFDDEANAALDGADGARAFWDRQPPGYRRLVTHWVMSAKRQETRGSASRPWSRRVNGRAADLSSPGARAAASALDEERLAVRPGAQRPRARPPVADRVAVEPRHGQHARHRRATRTPRRRPPARRASASPRPGGGPRRPPSAAATSGSCRAGSRSSSAGRRQLRRRRRRALPDEEDVRRRRLGEVAGQGQEHRVLRARAGAPRAGRTRSRRGDVVLSVTIGLAGSRRTADTTSDSPRSRWSAGGGTTGQAWIAMVAVSRTPRGGSSPRDAHAPRETVIRIEASASGPSRPSAASSAAIPSASRASRSAGSVDRRGPSAERRSRATCSASSVDPAATRAERLEHPVAQLEPAVEHRDVRLARPAAARRRPRRTAGSPSLRRSGGHLDRADRRQRPARLGDGLVPLVDAGRCAT